MRAVPTRNTSPELIVRALLSHAGIRYRLHCKKLPGTPDIVFAGRQKAIFINGCFWHAHEGCPKGRPPQSRTEYWIPKLQANKARDQRNVAELESMGWKALTVWQCETKDLVALDARLIDFLDVHK